MEMQMLGDGKYIIVATGYDPTVNSPTLLILVQQN